jgi:hypothetical protein
MIGLERGDQRAHSWREHNQITGTFAAVYVWATPAGTNTVIPRTDGFGWIGIAERQFAFQDVPRFAIGMVDMKRRRATAAPLMDSKRTARCGERGGFMRRS